MKGLTRFHGLPSSDSTSAADGVVVENDYVGLSEAASSADQDAEARDEREEDYLELGLSLGAKKVAGGGGGKATAEVAAPWGQCRRILTAKVFPSLVPRASPSSSSTSSVSSPSAALVGGVGGGGGVAGSKRAADSVSPDVVESGQPPSQVVVGWPPIRAFRMNSLFNQSKDNTSQTDAAVPKKTNRNNNTSTKEAKGNNDQACNGRAAVSSRFVKVNMDGDPIGRKVDLNAHQSYETLALSLELMFHKPTMALNTSVHGVKASRLLDGSSEFALTYEDRDGDWMLVGDVPWGMFLDTVRRLRIMRTSDASGLAPRFQSSNKSCGLIHKASLERR